MNIYKVIKGRRSIRTYKSRKIPDDVINRVLDAARRAPSAKNLQPWQFIVVNDRELIDAVAGGPTRNQSFIAQAPIVLVACALEREAFEYMGGYWNSAVLDVAIAFDHLTLAAHAEGLGTCWIGAFDEAAVKNLFAIPEYVKVVALTPLGYRAEDPPEHGRKSLEHILFYNRWSSQ